MLKRLNAFTLVIAALMWPVQARAGSSAFETYGDIGQAAIPAIAALITLAKEDAEGLTRFRDLTVGTFGTVYGLKRAVSRERPDGGDARSFPSGHTSSAFSGASYLHYRYGWKYGLPAYMAAAAVGASRVVAGRHYWTDVAAGAVIANVFAYYIVRTDNDNLSLTPVIEIERSRFALILTIKF